MYTSLMFQFPPACARNLRFQCRPIYYTTGCCCFQSQAQIYCKPIIGSIVLMFSGRQLITFNSPSLVTIGGKKDAMGNLVRPFKGLISGKYRRQFRGLISGEYRRKPQAFRSFDNFLKIVQYQYNSLEIECRGASCLTSCFHVSRLLATSLLIQEQVSMDRRGSASLQVFRQHKKMSQKRL